MAQHRERGIYAFATPRDGRIRLPWHFRNEVEHYGCLDLRPCYDNRAFRISRWLESESPFYKAVEPMRYTELDEFSYESWNARMRPWERLGELIARMPEFHTADENRHYVNRTLDYIIDHDSKRDHVQVVRPPYNGQPLVCLIRSNKVTIL